MNSPVTFGQWVRLRRRAVDLTQEQLADQVGCSVSAIRKIETGERRPSRQIVELLAQALYIPQQDRVMFMNVARGERSLDSLPEAVPDGAVLPQPRPPERRAGAIPVPLTPLVGREHEVERVFVLLASPNCRLITLFGPGGIGKTRVVIRAATLAREKLAQQFPDGVYYVSLTPLTSIKFLATAVADALDFTFFGPEEPETQLAHYLREKQLLLVLDNVEHLLKDVSLITRLLEEAPGLKLLLTSRERLNIQAEWLFEIHGLPVPPSTDEVDTAMLAENYSAVALFLQTARRVLPDFRLDDDNRADILKICQILEGMPLGIELAASWVRVLSCREIAEEISRNLDFLSTHDRNVPERHRSLRAAFDHSWKILAVEERNSLQRLSVFRGLITREAAAAVSGASLDLLMSLADQSLLRRSGSGYSLHELVRQYAAARLAEDTLEEEQAHEAHSAYFLSLLEKNKDALMSPRSKEAIELLSLQIDNLRLAWDWAALRQHFEPIQRAADSLHYLLEMRGSFLEGVTIFSQTAEKLGGWDPHPQELLPVQQLVLGHLYVEEAFFNMRLGKQGQADPLFNLSVALLKPLALRGMNEAREALSEALVYQATARYHMGSFENARALAVEGLEFARQAGSRWNAAYALLLIGLNDHAMGQIDSAYRYIQESMFYWRQLGDPRGLSLGLGYASIVAHAAGKVTEAQAMLRECLDIGRAYGDRWGMATALNHLGQINLSLGGEYLEEAIRLLQESVNIYQDMGEPWNMTRAMIRLGEAYHGSGEDDVAQEILFEAIQMAWQSPVIPLALDAMLMLAIVLADRGVHDCAFRLLATVREHPMCYMETRERAESLWKELAELDQATVPTGAQDLDRMVETVLRWAKTGSGMCE